VSFQRHSTSLFSIYDDPGTSSARRSASPILSPNGGSNARQDPVDPTVTLAPKLPIRIRKPSLGKRKKSEMAEKSTDPASAKQKTDGAEVKAGTSSQEGEPSSAGPGWSDEGDTTITPGGSSSSAVVDNSDLIQDLQEEDLHDLTNEDGDDDGQSVISISTSVISEIFANALGPVNTEHPRADDRYDDIDRAPPGVFDDDMYDDYDLDADDYGEYEDVEDGGNVDFGLYDDDDGDDGIDDYDVYEGDYGDEFDEEDEDEDDYEDVDDDYDDGDEAMYPDRRSADTEFGGVELIHPRRMFRGAKNIETVKDCTPFCHYHHQHEDILMTR
jgi:WD and tetratricopeptide repeat-containing protein 1